MEQEGKAKKQKKSVCKSTHNISVSPEKTKNIIRNRMQSKLEAAHAQLHSKEKRYWMQQAQTLFGEESGTPEEERDLATQLMRKRTVTSLASKFNSEAKKPHDEFERNGVFEPKDDAPQQSPVPESQDDVEPTPTLNETLPVETQNEDASATDKGDKEEDDELPNPFLESMKDFGEE